MSNVDAETGRPGDDEMVGVSDAEITALLQQHEGFVRQRVKRRVTLMPHLAMHEDDLLQEGRLALALAARRFDAGRGVTFLSYAGRWVDHLQLNFANRRAQLIRFWNGVPPSYLSLDAPMDDDDERMMHGALRAPEAEVMHCDDEAQVALLRAALSRLPRRMQRVLWLRHAEGRAFSAIGEELGVTRERVRQIERVAMTRLRLSYGSAARDGAGRGAQGAGRGALGAGSRAQGAGSREQGEAQARKPMLLDGEGVAA